MSATGKSISITLPKPLVDDIEKGARKVGISRSRFISNLLLKWQEGNKKLNIQDQISTKNRPPNKCENRENTGFCSLYDQRCEILQKEARSCVGYKDETTRGK